MRSDTALDISIVVPIYNEQDNVIALYTAITEAMRRMKCGYELIMIDDGSSDGSYALLAELAKEDPCLKLIRFRRNFGQTAAMAAGFDVASGSIIIPMDGDLQNDPADIPRLVDKIHEGFDVVSGWRRDRKDTFITRKIPSMLANSLISSLTGVHLHDYGCTLKAYRREVLEGINLYGEMHRFVPALASQVGAKVTELPVNHYPRLHGVSKYGISRTLRSDDGQIPVGIFYQADPTVRQMGGLYHHAGCFYRDDDLIYETVRTSQHEP